MLNLWVLWDHFSNKIFENCFFRSGKLYFSVNTLRFVVFQGKVSQDLSTSILRILTIQFHTFSAQQFFGHLAVFFGNRFTTRTLFVFALAILADLMELQTSKPLRFSRSWCGSANLAIQIVAHIRDSLVQIFKRRRHFFLVRNSRNSLEFSKEIVTRVFVLI